MACLNGQGRPLAVAVSFLCGAFLITPVSGYLLAFVARCCGDTQLFGLWFGLICGYMVTTLISMVAVARTGAPSRRRRSAAPSARRRAASTRPRRRERRRSSTPSRRPTRASTELHAVLCV